MKTGKSKNPIRRFLVGSFIGLFIFSIVIFSLFGMNLRQKSNAAVYQIGEIYMSGLNKQMASHFETVMNLRFSQVNGIVSVVHAQDFDDNETLYKELIYRAQVREFDYLALYSITGGFETLFGPVIRPLYPENFREALLRGEQRVTVGIDAEGNEVALLGVGAAYPMQSGEQSVALVAAMPLDYIANFLELSDEDQLAYYHIVRSDGSFVIQNSNKELVNLFEQLYNQNISASEEPSEDPLIRELGDALADGRNYETIVDVNGEKRQVGMARLPYSEWSLVSVMPYNVMNDIINKLSSQRASMTLLSCASILLVLTLIFFRYYLMNSAQVKELDHARQSALEASRAKSEFLANMSHDIRTPMNAIIGMTAIATDHIDDRQRVQSCLKKITLSSRHLLGLINDVLDLSKIESGKLTLTEERISLRDAVEGVVSIIQPQVQSKKQSFEIHVENIFAENVWCDGVRLNQVLLNLLSNAVKYTQEGGRIELFLSEEASPLGEDHVRTHIEVVDNGIGMSPEFLEKIFESYSRADVTRVHKTEGAGLGMAITKYIVDAMKGTIDIQSELDKGTRITIVFDFETTDAGEVDMILPAWNVLIIDDDEVLCESAADLLKSIGIKAEWMSAGTEAVDLISQRHQEGNDFQIILVDWKLPGIDGIHLAKKIRGILGDGVPILLMSAYDWGNYEEKARAAGINGFIGKPLFKSTLYHALRPYMEVDTENDQSRGDDIDLSGRHILLAEDNALNWEIANELLSDMGLKLDWAEDGQICLDKFRQSPVGYYEAILMDLRMPNMTGYEATSAIRALDREDAASVPIIAMSADAFSDDVQRCLEGGMNAHIAKPIDVTKLMNILKKFLKGPDSSKKE